MYGQKPPDDELDDYYIIDNNNPFLSDVLQRESQFKSQLKLQISSQLKTMDYYPKDYPALKVGIKSFAGLPDIITPGLNFPTNPCVEVPVQKEEDRPVIFAAKSTRSLDI